VCCTLPAPSQRGQWQRHGSEAVCNLCAVQQQQQHQEYQQVSLLFKQACFVKRSWAAACCCPVAGKVRLGWLAGRLAGWQAGRLAGWQAACSPLVLFMHRATAGFVWEAGNTGVWKPAPMKTPMPANAFLSKFQSHGLHLQERRVYMRLKDMLCEYTHIA